MQHHTTVEGVGIKKIIKALVNAQDTFVTVEYKLNKPSAERKADIVFDAAEEIRTLSVSELNDDTLDELLGNLYETAKGNNVRTEDYVVTRLESGLTINEAGYILFGSPNGIKSVLPLNIISVIVDGVKYVR